MASLRFKKDGTPFVDFRVQSERYRPEFESVNDAKKFKLFADADPVGAFKFWQESLQSVEKPSDFISFKEKLESFKTDYCAKRSNKNDMLRIADDFFRFVLLKAEAKDDIDLRLVNLEFYSGFQSSLLESGLTNASVNRYFTTVKTFSRRMWRAQYVPVPYGSMVETLEAERQVKRVAWLQESTPKLIEELLRREVDPVLVDIARSMDFTPFGPIDFGRLKWKSMNFKLGEINTFRMKGRGRRDWDLPMLLGYQKLLLDIKKRHEAIGLGQPGDFVYLTLDKKPVDRFWISKSLERARKAAGIDEVPYSSRHRIISDLHDKTDLKTASKFAGHASVKTTERHYLVGGDEDFRKRVKKAFAK